MTSGIDDTNIVKKIMGQRLTDVRKARGLTRQGAVDALNESEFAPSFERRKFLGIETYKKWEYRENPVDIEWLPAICEVYSCDVGYLFGEYEEYKREYADFKVKTGLKQDAALKLEQIKKLSDAEQESGFNRFSSLNTQRLQALNCLLENETNSNILLRLYQILLCGYDTIVVDQKGDNGETIVASGNMAALHDSRSDIDGTIISAADAQTIFLLRLQTDLLKLKEKLHQTGNRISVQL